MKCLLGDEHMYHRRYTSIFSRYCISRPSYLENGEYVIYAIKQYQCLIECPDSSSGGYRGGAGYAPPPFPSPPLPFFRHLASLLPIRPLHDFVTWVLCAPLLCQNPWSISAQMFHTKATHEHTKFVKLWNNVGVTINQMYYLKSPEIIDWSNMQRLSFTLCCYQVT